MSVVEPGLVRTKLQDHVTDKSANEWLDGVRDSLEWLVADDIARTVGLGGVCVGGGGRNPAAGQCSGGAERSPG